MPTVADLITAKDRDTLFAEGLAVAQGEGLPTTAWQPGRPLHLVPAHPPPPADLHRRQLPRPAPPLGRHRIDAEDHGHFTKREQTVRGVDHVPQRQRLGRCLGHGAPRTVARRTARRPSD
jgi:hypothetical protein